MASPSDHVAGLKADAKQISDNMWEAAVRGMAFPNENQAAMFMAGREMFCVDVDGKVHGDPLAVIEHLKTLNPARNPGIATVLALARLAARAQSKDEKA
jgi:hypothetical protein